MASTTPYELLITQKLEQVPLPDLADSIWASIETQLDAPFPGEDGNDTPIEYPPQKGLPGTGKLFYIAVPALLFTAAWFYFKNKKQQPPEKAIPVLEARPDSVSTDSSGNLLDPGKNPDIQNKIKKQEDNPDTQHSFILPGLPADSAFRLLTPPVQQDTASLLTAPPVVIIADTALKTPPSKKTKGVKGITNNDYKIITERKDSAKKDH